LDLFYCSKVLYQKLSYCKVLLLFNVFFALEEPSLSVGRIRTTIFDSARWDVIKDRDFFLVDLIDNDRVVLIFCYELQLMVIVHIN
jgi:hypothetical protein